MDEETHERIRATIAKVPRGRVAAYGDIAKMADAPSPRIVGWVLKEDGGDLPWHRIVRTDGSVAKPRQLPMLREEGLEIPGDKIDMARYRWDPDSDSDE
jgi:alkylated DNA nucleotide flippase Atl1